MERLTEVWDSTKMQRLYMLKFSHMVHRYVHKSVTWCDVLNPTPEEIRELIKEHKFPPDFTTDLTAMTPRSDVIAHKDALKVTLDYPIVKRTDIDHPHEVKFIATKKALITIRFEDIEAIHRYSKEFEVLSMVANKSNTLTGGGLMAALITYLYESLDHKLDYLESKLNDIEQEIFKEREREMVSEISLLGRRVISFRHVVSTHEQVLLKLPDGFETAFGKKARAFVDPIPSAFDHVFRRVQAIQRTLDELRDTNTALLTTKQNEIMKILTIMAFITFPLTLFTSMFGMNTQTTPLVGQKNDFWIIVGVMLVASIVFFAFFKYKKWM